MTHPLREVLQALESGHNRAMAEFTVKTLQLKLRPGSEAWLNAAAIEVNQVWNWCREVCTKASKPFYGKPRYFSAFDLNKLLAGTTYVMDYIGAQSIESVAAEYITRVKKARHQVRWRKSFGSKRSLGWVPFRREQCRFKDGAVVFAGRRFRVYDSHGLGAYDFRGGSFSQNALGEWFLNVWVRVPTGAPELPTKAVGIDLGLRTIATASDGQSLEAGRWTNTYSEKLGNAQRRGHKRQAKRIHKKVANCRKDALHKFSRKLVSECGAIYIGDVSSSKLVKTKMAKSVLDSGWGMLRTMLQYKGHQAGRIVENVNEAFTTRACSCCGSLTGPSGRTGLVVRAWTCGDCGTPHDRDVNAARNILARGLSGPSAGTNGGANHA